MINKKEDLIIRENINSSLLNFIKSTKPTNIIVFTQEKIKHRASQILDNISEHCDINIIILEDGEKAKEPNNAVTSIKLLTELNCDKESLLISLGGGSVSDHVWFVASIFKRGIKFNLSFL